MTDQPISEDRLLILDRYANDSEAMSGLELINMYLCIVETRRRVHYLGEGTSCRERVVFFYEDVGVIYLLRVCKCQHLSLLLMIEVIVSTWVGNVKPEDHFLKEVALFLKK